MEQATNILTSKCQGDTGFSWKSKTQWHTGLKKFQTFDLIYFNGKRNYGDVESQNCWIFQPISSNFTMPAGDTEPIAAWKSKGSSGENIKSPTILDNSLKRGTWNKKEIFTHKKLVSLFIVYELDTWFRNSNTKNMLLDCLFGAIKLIKYADPDKYRYNGYGIRFGARLHFSLQISKWGEKTLLFLIRKIVYQVILIIKERYPSSWWRANR